MALVATEILRIGNIIAALPGNVVSPEAVLVYGWQDKVTDVATSDEQPPKRASKRRAAA